MTHEEELEIDQLVNNAYRRTMRNWANVMSLDAAHAFTRIREPDFWFSQREREVKTAAYRHHFELSKHISQDIENRILGLPPYGPAVALSCDGDDADAFTRIREHVRVVGWVMKKLREIEDNNDKRSKAEDVRITKIIDATDIRGDKMRGLFSEELENQRVYYSRLIHARADAHLDADGGA